jgi:hypothetical protein
MSSTFVFSRLGIAARLALAALLVGLILLATFAVIG